MFSVLKKMLKRELGREEYMEYARLIKSNLREEKSRNDELGEVFYRFLTEKTPEELFCLRVRMEQSMMDTYRITKQYMGVFIAYILGFSVLGEFTAEMVAVPSMLIISAAFLFKTFEFLANKFCYVDAHMMILLKNALDKVLIEKGRQRKQEQQEI